jgi:hypothetical protein
MDKYEAIDQYIRQARIERSVYLAELIADSIFVTWKGVKSAAEVLFSVARARNPKGVFTFDA